MESDISGYLRKMHVQFSWWSMFALCLYGFGIGWSAFSANTVDLIISLGSIGIAFRALVAAFRSKKRNAEYKEVLRQLRGELAEVTELDEYRYQILSRLQDNLQEFLTRQHINFSNPKLKF